MNQPRAVRTGFGRIGPDSGASHLDQARGGCIPWGRGRKRAGIATFGARRESVSLRAVRVLIALLLLGVLAACKQKATAALESTAPEAVAGVASKAGGFLAYTHSLSFEVAPESISPRVSAIQSACQDERFGACSVLVVESTSGRHATGRIAMRAVPAAVEALVALAADGTQPASRRTSAEDLADAVAEVTDSRDLLTRQRATLLEFSQRKDLSVTDLITLSDTLAATDARLQSLAQEAAEQRRRIETNHLAIDFASNAKWEAESSFSLAAIWTTFTSNLQYGVDGAAEYVGYFLPIMLLVFPLALLWRWAWRWATRNSRAKAG